MHQKPCQEKLWNKQHKQEEGELFGHAIEQHAPGQHSHSHQNVVEKLRKIQLITSTR